MPISLSSAIAVVKVGDTATAQTLLAQLLRQDVRNEGAWLLLAQCVTDENQRRTCLQRVIALNPANELAQRLLAIMDDVPALPAMEVDAFQPRPFVEDGQTASLESQEHQKPEHPSTPDFVPQPFALTFAETEPASSGANHANHTAALPPWLRFPR